MFVLHQCRLASLPSLGAAQGASSEEPNIAPGLSKHTGLLSPNLRFSFSPGLLRSRRHLCNARVQACNLLQPQSEAALDERRNVLKLH